MTVLVPCAANRGTLPKTRHMRHERMAQDPEEALPPYFGISPDEALAELGAAGRHPRPRGDRRDLRPRPRRPRQPRPRGGRPQDPAALLDLGDHPLPDPRRPGPLPPRPPRQPRPPPGPHRDRRAAPSGSPSTRCCGCAPTSPPRGPAPSPTPRGARPGCRPRSRRSPTSRAASARPRWPRTSRCRPRSTATACSSSTSTARAR